MKIEGSYQLQAPRERVYLLLIDPQVLQRCLPGCERLEKTAADVYVATIQAGVGAIKGLFNGHVRLEDLRPPQHYRIVVDGKGASGFMKGSGDLDFEDQGSTTVIRYAGEVQVGGMIAGVGQRMIQGTAKMMVSQFFTALEAEARTVVVEPAQKHGFFHNTLRWLTAWLRRAGRAQS